MGLFDFLFGKRREPWDVGPATGPAKLVTVLVEGDGSFSLDAVGESRYQDALEEITGGKTWEGHQMQVHAQLVPERDNPYDPNAVIVAVAGKIVGYLDREQAKRWRGELFDKGISGAGCNGLITGGWDRGDGRPGHFGVKLDVAHPIRIIARSE